MFYSFNMQKIWRGAALLLAILLSSFLFANFNKENHDNDIGFFFDEHGNHLEINGLLCNGLVVPEGLVHNFESLWK